MCNEGNFGTEMREVLQNMRETQVVLEGLDWGIFCLSLCCCSHNIKPVELPFEFLFLLCVKQSGG